MFNFNLKKHIEASISIRLKSKQFSYSNSNTRNFCLDKVFVAKFVLFLENSETKGKLLSCFLYHFSAQIMFSPNEWPGHKSRALQFNSINFNETARPFVSQSGRSVSQEKVNLSLNDLRKPEEKFIATKSDQISPKFEQSVEFEILMPGFVTAKHSAHPARQSSLLQDNIYFSDVCEWLQLIKQMRSKESQQNWWKFEEISLVVLWNFPVFAPHKGNISGLGLN